MLLAVKMLQSALNFVVIRSLSNFSIKKWNGLRDLICANGTGLTALGVVDNQAARSGWQN
jgi:hypothetical protein